MNVLVIIILNVHTIQYQLANNPYIKQRLTHAHAKHEMYTSRNRKGDLKKYN